MAIECYFTDCKHHEKDEPFCYMPECVATKAEIVEFTETRKKYLEEANKK